MGRPRGQHFSTNRVLEKLIPGSLVEYTETSKLKTNPGVQNHLGMRRLLFLEIMKASLAEILKTGGCEEINPEQVKRGRS